MELYTLWRIVWRRWWLVAIPTLVAAGFALVRYQAPQPVYTVGMRFTAAQAPDLEAMPDATDPYEDTHYVPWLASEYLVNALAHWVQTTSFAEAVSAQLAAQGVEIDPAALAFASDNQRSVMGVYINWHDRAQLQQIAEAAAAVLQAQSADYFPQTAAGPVTVTRLDRIAVGEVPPSLVARVQPLLPVAVGLAAGLALAFLVAYLDPTIYTPDELDALDIDVLAAIPRKQR